MHDPKIYIKNYIKNTTALMKYKDGEDYEKWKNPQKKSFSLFWEWTNFKNAI